MFETLDRLPSDPLLGILERYNKDENPHKIDLGVGVYKNEQGDTPVMRAVKSAEAELLSQQRSKTYLGAMGDSQFTQLICQLAFGEKCYQTIQQRIAGLQTPGGCGALRVAAELLVRAKPDAKIWVSDPTWANHIPLLGAAGLSIETYPYYDYDNKTIRFDEMLACLKTVPEGDLVLLHACCHNPCGADLSQAQWDEIVDLCQKRKLIPFVDMAYQGFGENLEKDAYGVRAIAAAIPEAIFTVSCSKNFGLYRDRVGAVIFLADSSQQAQALTTNLVHIVRAIYSMPPDHGAAVVANILSDATLRVEWQEELVEMSARITLMREQLSAKMAQIGAEQFQFVTQERGMFSFLGITEAQVETLAKDYSIYMAGSSRVNIAGLSTKNLDYFCQSLAKVISK